MKVVIDTNALIYAAENKINLWQLLAGNEIIVPNLVLEELELISKSAVKASDRKAAFVALKILENASFTSAELSGASVDSAIANFAKSEKAAVLTNDTELKKRLQKAYVKVLHIRQRKYIEEWT